MSNTITARRIGQFRPVAEQLPPQLTAPVRHTPHYVATNWGPPPAGLEWSDVPSIADRSDAHRRVVVGGIGAALVGVTLLGALLMTVPALSAQLPASSPVAELPVH
ncbi:hypothetical protein [Pseudonocardia spinosispora]|uniref:hypothetical protein n=1 Tax=Pseudonocardia spinosispora TaxID=103441 RepID=UPI00040DCB68|nr:hypothetical protein [Pseudonocardia spinosispora]